jgi:hypothetical protein
VVEQLAHEIEYAGLPSARCGLRLPTQMKKDVDPECFEILGVSRIERVHLAPVRLQPYQNLALAGGQRLLRKLERYIHQAVLVLGCANAAELMN